MILFWHASFAKCMCKTALFSRPTPRTKSAVADVQVPGNIRRAEHFCQFLSRLVNYMKGRISVQAVEQESCSTFLASLQEQMAIDGGLLIHHVCSQWAVNIPFFVASIAYPELDRQSAEGICLYASFLNLWVHICLLC